METMLKAASGAIRSFACDEEGAQVVEYALIIAVVSIVLVVALKELTGASFTGLITKVTNCLSSGASCTG